MQQSAKQKAGIFHSLDKCPGLMTPWQPCLQRVQRESHSRQSVDRELHPVAKPQMANLDGCSMSCNHFSGKSVGNFVKCPGKKQSFGVLDPLTNGENQLTKEKKNQNQQYTYSCSGDSHYKKL